MHSFFCDRALKFNLYQVATYDIKRQDTFQSCSLVSCSLALLVFWFFASGMFSPGFWFVVWLPPFLARLFSPPFVFELLRSGPDPVGGRAPTPPRPADLAGGRAPTPSAVGPRPRRRWIHDPLGGRPFNGSNLLAVCSGRRVFAASFCLGPVTGPG